MALFNFGKRKVQGDHLRDMKTGKGSEKDQSNRQSKAIKYDDRRCLQLYQSGNFGQRVINRIAKDSVRNWFEIKCEYKTELETIDVGRMILNRLEELNVKKRLEELMIWKSVFNKGSAIYISTSHDNSIGKQEEPITLGTLKKIDFINTIDYPDRLTITIPNKSDPTKADYNKPEFRIMGKTVHEDRIRWICDSFTAEELEGTSLMASIKDAIIATDNALWSTSLMLKDIAGKIFKSKWLLNLTPTERAEFLAQLSYVMDSQSAIALDTDEDYSRMQNSSMQGINNIYEFIFDNLAGSSGISRMVLLGKAHGVVGSDDNEAQNYYASIRQLQESDIIPILNYLVKLILNEKESEIYKKTQGACKDLDYEIKPISLIELTPKAKAEIRLIDAQADQIDITMGKTSPQEARDNDTRYSEVLEQEESLDEDKLNMEPPPINLEVQKLKANMQGNLNG
jgi:phage-related protein (TIGR01555 family)